MREENTISNIKIDGITYTINDPSKASNESVLKVERITTENNSLLSSANLKLDELLSKLGGNISEYDINKELDEIQLSLLDLLKCNDEHISLNQNNSILDINEKLDTLLNRLSTIKE